MNLRELSTLLKLSQTTVSRALNGFPEVNAATRERVKAAAELHGYRPSAAARRLATGQSNAVGVGQYIPAGDEVGRHSVAGEGETHSAQRGA